MEPRLSLVTLAVRDLRAARRFYVEGLGWEPLHDLDDVVMVRAGEHLGLSLWDAEEFACEVGASTLGTGIAPITLAHNVGSDDEVDAVLADMESAGATVIEPGSRREWGGYSGYAADPDGYRWEVANAGPGPLTDLVVP